MPSCPPTKRRSQASSCKASDEARAQEVVKGLPVSAGQCPQLGGQREGDQEVSDRQAQTFLVCRPRFGLIVPALGAVAVPARVIAVTVLVALLAVVDLTAKRRSAALLNVSHGPEVRGQHSVAELSPVLRAYGDGKSRQSRPSQIAHDLIDGFHGQLFGSDGQMGVDAGSGWRTMPQILLNQAQVDSGLQQMRSPRNGVACGPKPVCGCRFV